MTARYLLCPGVVRSRSDGQVHHIGAGQLAHLYGLNMAACVVLPAAGGRPWLERQREELIARAERGELIKLHPRHDGDYTLPTEPRRYGCHNRAPLKTSTELYDHNGRLVASWPHVMTTDCQYTLSDLGQADARCTGCRWRKEPTHA